MHGGTQPIGPFSPSFKTGEFSRHLPARMSAVLAGIDGYDVLDLTDRIKVLDARLIDVIQRADSGESGERWRQLKAEWDKVQEARAAGDTAAMALALNEVGKLITQGLSDWNLWSQVEDSIVKTTKVVESQRKRAIENSEMLTAIDARAMMRAMAEGLRRSVDEHVTDPELKREIFVSASTEFARLVGRVDVVSKEVS